jgi:hypothetical protein
MGSIGHLLKPTAYIYTMSYILHMHRVDPIEPRDPAPSYPHSFAT